MELAEYTFEALRQDREFVLYRGQHRGEAQVLRPEIAAVARGMLAQVVEEGTARGLKLALAEPSGRRHTVSGKTGTGDHRYVVHAKNGSVVESRVVSRAATFAFLLDDRYFGTVTAYVPGSEAARFHFTSALPVRILGHLLPTLDRLSASPPWVSNVSQGTPRAAAIVDRPSLLGHDS